MKVNKYLLFIIIMLVGVLFYFVLLSDTGDFQSIRSATQGNLLNVNKGTPFEKVELDKIVKFKFIGNNLYVDLTTGVIYYKDVINRVMSVLVKENGTPKNIKEYVPVKEFEEYRKSILEK